MSKKHYIESQLADLNPQSFYIEFGFKTRGHGEQQFMQVVKRVYDETENDNFKQLLNNEFIENNFLLSFLMTIFAMD